jgi:hypothetical protein
VVELARAQGFTSDEHFTVDGTLLEAWASEKLSAETERRGIVRRTMRVIPRSIFMGSGPVNS